MPSKVYRGFESPSLRQIMGIVIRNTAGLCQKRSTSGWQANPLSKKKILKTIGITADPGSREL